MGVKPPPLFPLIFDAFWHPVGSASSPAGVPLVSLWLRVGPLWLPVGSASAPFRVLSFRFGPRWLRFDSASFCFGSLWLRFGSALIGSVAFGFASSLFRLSLGSLWFYLGCRRLCVGPASFIFKFASVPLGFLRGHAGALYEFRFDSQWCPVGFVGFPLVSFWFSLVPLASLCSPFGALLVSVRLPFGTFGFLLRPFCFPWFSPGSLLASFGRPLVSRRFPLVVFWSPSFRFGFFWCRFGFARVPFGVPLVSFWFH